MKKSIIIWAFAALSLSTVAACNNSSKSTEKHQAKSKYTCTMHPDLSFDKPGVCSKCGMELVERDTTGDK